MKYQNMVPGIFLSRPNRFVACVEINGIPETVHVKNTGRCKELLLAGATVWCEKSANQHRKTKYDLICVQKGHRLINMDSQAPNAAVCQWLQSGGFGNITQLRQEVTYGDSRFDFSFVKDGKTCYLEVKGVTLETDGHCRFPDAPTLRGTKHLNGLMKAVQDGLGAYVLFVIQTEKVHDLCPNTDTDPLFSRTLQQAQASGVQIFAMDCTVTPEEMVLRHPVPVCLSCANCTK